MDYAAEQIETLSLIKIILLIVACFKLSFLIYFDLQLFENRTCHVFLKAL